MAVFLWPDVDVQSPDEKSVITYVSTLYDAFPKVPDGVDGISPNVSKGTLCCIPTQFHNYVIA